MTTEERDEWADDHGYTRGRCPNCHRIVWSDTGYFECSYCGSHTGDDKEDEEIAEDPEMVLPVLPIQSDQKK